MIPPIVVYVYFGSGVFCAFVLTVAIAPRSWGSGPELRRLASVVFACVPAWPLIVGVMLALQSERIVEILTKWESE